MIATARHTIDPTLRALLLSALAHPADQTLLRALSDWITERLPATESTLVARIEGDHAVTRYRRFAEVLCRAAQDRLDTLVWPPKIRSAGRGGLSARVRNAVMRDHLPRATNYRDVVPNFDPNPAVAKIQNMDMGTLLNRLWRRSNDGTDTKDYIAAVLAANGLPGPFGPPSEV